MAKMTIDYNKLEELGNKLNKYKETNNNIFVSFENNINSLNDNWTSSNKDIIMEYADIIKKNMKNNGAYLHLFGSLLKDIKQNFEISEEKYLLLIEDEENEQIRS